MLRNLSDRLILRLWGVLAYLLLPLLLPYYFFRMLTNRRYRAGLRQRLTLYTKAEVARLKEGPHLWIHVASMGELQAARALIRKLKEALPSTRLLVSTFTDTGHRLARELEEIDAAIYLPLDVHLLCRRAVRLIRPTHVIIFETELWPNWIRAIAAQGRGVLLINGRVSDRSFRRYFRLRGLFGPVLRCFSAILAQSEVDRERFSRLGANTGTLSAPGNIKFGAVCLHADASMRRLWRGLLGLSDGDMLLLAGSTFRGEELMMANIRKTLSGEGRSTRLLIAPRHVERSFAIVRELESASHRVARRSEGGSFADGSDVVLLDTVGELQDAYAAADIVFMGKSICTPGGQNPLEPAVWQRPILSGPRTQNFRDVYSMLEQADGVVIVENESQAAEAIRALHDDVEKRNTLGRNAYGVVSRNQGVMERVLETVLVHLQTTNECTGSSDAGGYTRKVS